VNNSTEDLLDPAEIASLMSAAERERLAGAELSNRGRADYPTEVDRLSAELRLAIAPEAEISRRLAEARPFELPALDAAEETNSRALAAEAGAVDRELQFELGRAELSRDEADGLREGSVLALDKLAGDPVDIVVDGRLIARGEVLVLDEKFCVRVTEVLTPLRAGFATELAPS
jgi:flagellar motor switch protein FliN/FliY